MREIKFRAYLNKENKMLEVKSLHIGTNKIMYGYSSHSQSFGNKTTSISDCVLMQYTGFKDKNDKEIYEGDIFVDDEFQLTYICVFEEGCFRLKCYGFVERYVSDNATNEFWEEIECDPISFYEIKNMEVIGNIYENPDLLGE